MEAAVGITENMKSSENVKELVNQLNQPLDESEMLRALPSVQLPATTSKVPTSGKKRKRHVSALNYGGKYSDLSIAELNQLENFIRWHRQTIENYFEKKSRKPLD